MRFWEYLQGLGFWLGVVTGILSNLATLFISKIFEYIYPILKRCLRNVWDLICQAVSRISFPTGGMRNITHFAGQVLEIIVLFAINCLLIWGMLYEVHKNLVRLEVIFGADDRAKTTVSHQVDTRDCRTPRYGVYKGGKCKRAIQRSTIEYPSNSVLRDGGSLYSIVDAPQ